MQYCVCIVVNCKRKDNRLGGLPIDCPLSLFYGVEIFRVLEVCLLASDSNRQHTEHFLKPEKLHVLSQGFYKWWY